MEVLMKKHLFILSLVYGILIFTLNFRVAVAQQSGLPDSLRSHDVFNDYNPNLVVPPYIYYPPSPDNPLIYTNVNISNNPPFPHNEPAIKISKKNPNRVVAGWRDFRLSFNPAWRRVGYSYSTDFGATWSASALIDSTLLGGGLLRNSDASVTVDTAGNFYITTIALNNVNSNGTLAIFKSTDGGITFPIGQILAQGYNEDKEMVTTDLVPGSSFRNNIYISWSRLNLSPDIRLIRSTNGGVSWSAPVNVSSSSTNGQGSDPAVGVNGEVYVVWVNYSYNTQYFNKSTNGGLSFGTPVIVASGTAPYIPWSQTGPTTFPSIAVDFSGGPGNGNIYITWCDGRNGDADVFLSRSTDHGSTWSSAIRVNNDPVSNGKVQAWPWIAVNDSGKIAILFYDTRNTPTTNIIEAWLALSDNGGASFTNEVLSSVQSPTNKPNSDVRFGDYIGVDFWGNKVVPVWTDERSGGYNQEIYTSVVDITTGVEPAANGIPDNFELEQNYPNPFNAASKIEFYLPEKSWVTLKVYDEMGREVSTSLDGWVDRGKQYVNFYGDNFASGVYFYKLTAGHYTETRKMVLVK
jgi:Secretion system C-terminal sorting domain